MDNSKKRTGGQLLVDNLLVHGVDTVFCVPGESYLAALDALRDVQDRIKVVVCRHEAAAGNMAEAYGKLTGRPGVCFVTRGPGATHASIASHIALQDSTPMIMFIGQVERETLEREAFQEVDFRTMFRPLAKWVTQIDDPRRIAEFVGRAFSTAVNGRPGPVVVALPEDVLAEDCEPVEFLSYRRAAAAPSGPDLHRLVDLIAGSERPLMILGGSGWTGQARADIAAFAEAFSLPTLVTFRRQDLFDNRHRLYGGVLGLGMTPAITRRVQSSDLLIVVGDRLSEAATQSYALINVPLPHQRMIHIHPGSDELGRVYQATLPINASMPEFAAAAARLAPPARTDRSGWSGDVRAEYLETIVPPKRDQPLDLAKVVAWLNTQLPHEAILTNGAGAYAAYIHRYYQYKAFPTQLAPACGAMGYGLPAAIAAKLVHPDRAVICFAGDGCFLMSSQDLATAVRYRLPIVILIINNESYGSIRMHQERRFPGRFFATDLNNPDFVAYARSFGANAERVETTEGFAPALRRALSADLPTVIELRLDIDTMLAQSPRRQ
jgi:acetolactate synthase-1/2/3 large subunit